MQTKVGAGALLLAVLAVPARGQVTSRVSLDTGEAQGNGTGETPSVSRDGRYVAFTSAATNLVAGDTNGAIDIFVRDRMLGTTERVSVSSGGLQGNDPSEYPSISADGRYVAFTSFASNLVVGDTNFSGDIFVRDRMLGVTERVSVDSNEVEGVGIFIGDAFISADGSHVAFCTTADNLVAGDTNTFSDIFVRDRIAGTTERVSVDSSGAEGNGDSFTPSLSEDGRFVAYWSAASNLVPSDSNARQDIFVRDRVAGTTERVSVDSGGAQGNGHSNLFRALSADGRYVAFHSLATNLVGADTNGSMDVFVHDRQTSTTERVSVDSGGAAGNGGSMFPDISADGARIAFFSSASNLVAGDTNGFMDVFVRDRLAGTTERVSVDSSGMQGDIQSTFCSMSTDGGHVAFASSATDLVPGDTNGVADIFVREFSGGPTFAFCFPEIGGVRSCPCGNPASAADLGCDSFITTSTTSGTGGAKLAASGLANASVANTLVFHVTKAHNPGSNTNLHVFWKGTATLAVGVKSGFGVRCVAGSLKRIYQGAGTGTGGLGSTNAVDFPNGTQTTDAWTASQMPASGTTLYYYDSFRDQQGPTTCNTANDRFNVSHALSVTWVP